MVLVSPSEPLVGHGFRLPLVRLRPGRRGRTVNVVGCWAQLPWRHPTSTLVLQTVVQSLVTLAFGLLYHLLQLAAIALSYFDLRLLAEGAKGGQLDVVDLASLAPAEA